VRRGAAGQELARGAARARARHVRG
jgi:hypothetical protein